MIRVAVTGFGVLSPIGLCQEQFFDSLAIGSSGIDLITRFEVDTFESRLAGEVKVLPDLSGPEASTAAKDPKVGFALAAAKEALEQAGTANFDSGTLLHLGTSMETIDLKMITFKRMKKLTSIVKTSLKRKGPPFRTSIDATVKHLVVKHGRPGMVLTNCSACAAGTQALGHGFRAVRSGRFHTAICGGFDSLIHPLALGGFQLLGALTPDNEKGKYACRPFDSARKGTVLGEGAAVFVLESMDHARAQGKEVLAEICGYGSTLDAHNLSAPDPGGDGASRAMEMALYDAGIGQEQVDHINTHGTGTLLNDEVEAIAIRRVFDGFWERIPVSATKSMTGHLIGAAGPIELGACLLPLRKGILPPNPSMDRVGRGCELNHVTEAGTPWNGEYIVSNSFGFGGQNGVLVIRKYYA